MGGSCLVILTSASITDWLSLFVDCITGIAIATILAVYVPRRLNEDRSLKTYFISELNSLSTEYNKFLQSLCVGTLKADIIIESFKFYNTKISDLQNSVNNYYKLDISIDRYIISAQIGITGSHEINEQYNQDHVVFNPTTKRNIRNSQTIFNRNLISAIAAINGANRKS